MKRLITIVLVLAVLLLSGCVTEARTPAEVLSTVKVGMTKSQVYDTVDVQYFRDNDSFLGATISGITVSKSGKVFDFNVGDIYHNSYYGYFFFDAATNADVALVVFGWSSDTVAATGTIPFARAQEIAEEKYGQPFRQEVSRELKDG